MSHLLEVNGLTTAFTGDYGKTVSVDHVDFYVDEGEVVCIVGESGCGKSVTSLSIMGLLGRGGAVIDGSVLFDGKNLLEMGEKELDEIRGNRITMIFQDPLTSLNPVFTVGNQITESIRKHLHLSKEEAAKRAESVLEKVGMPDAHAAMQKISPYSIRRHAPACHDRHGPLLQSGSAHRRRTHDGSGCDHPGTDHEPAEGAP